MAKKRNRSKIHLGILFTIVISLLFCSIFIWWRTKQHNIQLQDSIRQFNITGKTMTNLDLMVLSGVDTAYMECYERSCGRGQWPPLSERDFILYCYIFAIRDGNLGAGLNFSNMIIDNIHKGVVSGDMSLLSLVNQFAKKFEVERSIDSSHIGKFIAASILAEIYSGELSEDMKDTLLYQHYSDAAKKYVKCHTQINKR